MIVMIVMIDMIVRGLRFCRDGLLETHRALEK